MMLMKTFTKTFPLFITCMTIGHTGKGIVHFNVVYCRRAMVKIALRVATSIRATLYLKYLKCTIFMV